MAGIPKRVLYLIKRKKPIRGFKRFLREHQQRASIPNEFDIDYFEEYHRDKEQLGLSPWAVNEKPPLIIRQLWVSRLVTDFHTWQAELAAHYTDYYLAVWLYEPEFGRSQLVAGIKDRQTWYEGVFHKISDQPLPPAYQSLPGVAALEWTACAEVTAMWPDEFAEAGSWTLKKPHWEAETYDGEPIIVVQIGLVWVGQLPKQP